ncbi:MAG TPA: SCP2 sterol-binding domain-containing protein [Steroidobacteraceae bacterium]|jgi:ubiquinone biosynthesis protein UbiJ
MPATAAWLASAEALINRGIDASAQAGALARRLQGTVLQIDVDGITHLRATACGARLALLTADAAAAGGAGTADAAISGSLPALLRLFNGGTNPASGRRAAPGTPAQIRGDAEIANLYRELFLLARPDLEEELSRWIGDFAARRVAQVAARALAFARHARRTAGDNIAEYLQEESRDLVNKTELEEFLRGVDTLRETADRIDARLASLERRLAGGA